MEMVKVNAAFKTVNSALMDNLVLAAYRIILILIKVARLFAKIIEISVRFVKIITIASFAMMDIMCK